MPAYNAGLFIGEAIESVRAQTFDGDWELVIVNDGSTDNTASIIETYASMDHRIRIFHNKIGSGSAYQPRKRAIEEARGEIIAPLDADDAVSPDYLGFLFKIFISVDADIVYPLMDINGQPMTDYSGLTDKMLTGKECVALTLDGWKINCNGGLIRKELYLDSFNKCDLTGKGTYDDEFLTRILLLNARKVCFSDTRYHYRENPESVTRLYSGRSQEYLWNDVRLIEFTRNNFGKQSREYLLANRQAFHNYFNAMRWLNNTKVHDSDRIRVRTMMEQTRSVIDKDTLKGNVSPRYLLLFSLPQSMATGLLRLIDSIRNLHHY